MGLLLSLFYTRGGMKPLRNYYSPGDIPRASILRILWILEGGSSSIETSLSNNMPKRTRASATPFALK